MENGGNKQKFVHINSYYFLQTEFRQMASIANRYFVSLSPALTSIVRFIGLNFQFSPGKKGLAC